MGFANVNFLSILVAAVAAWIFGGIYYTSLSKPVDRGARQNHGTVQGRAGRQIRRGDGCTVHPGVSWARSSWLGCCTASLCISTCSRCGPASSAGALCWFGFVVTTVTVNNAFSNRKPMLTVIDSIAWLGVLLIIGAILGGWGR